MRRRTQKEDKKKMKGNGAMHNKKISHYMYYYINMQTYFAVNSQH
jgi:hypothetical protein